MSFSNIQELLWKGTEEIIINIIIIIVNFITFIRAIYNYTPETNHVCRVLVLFPNLCYM